LPAEIVFTSDAASLMARMRSLYPNVVLLIDDTSCCANSNIMARNGPPSWPTALLAEKNGIKIYANPILQRNNTLSQMLIDVMDFADDSLSLETNLGKRLIMTMSHSYSANVKSTGLSTYEIN